VPVKCAAVSKRPAAPQRRNNLFVFCVIALSVTIAAVLAATVLSHCSAASNGQAAGKEAVSSLSRGFNCTVDVTVDSKEYEVSLKKPARGDCTMAFVKPANLNSLSFEKTDEGLKVKFGLLEAAVDASSVPQTSIFNAVLGAFDACAKSGVSAKTQSGDLALSGTSSVGAFTMTFDSGMKPKSLSIPTLKLNANFKDFKYL
jgi:hypothetical protein